MTTIIPVNDGFIILTETDTDLDKIFNNCVDKELEHHDLTNQIPLELKAKRSVLIFRVDDHIFENTEQEIQQEILEKNGWIGNVANI